MTAPRAAFGAAVAAVLWSAFPGPPARAATTTFFPEVSLDVTRYDNVLYLSDTRTPDWTSRLGVVLPVKREGPRGSVGMTYSPSVFRYRDYSVLDHEDHQVALDASSTRRSSTLSFASRWSRSQNQGVEIDPQATDPYLVVQSVRETVGGEIAYEKEVGERWRWNTALRGDRTTYSRIEGLEGGDAEALENRTEWSARLAARRALTRATALGAEYGFRRYLLEESGDEDAHMLGLTMDIATSREASIGLRLGGFRRRQGPGGAYESGVQGGFRLERRFRPVAVTLDVEHSPASGSGLPGTSTDTSGSLTLTGTRQVRWRWAATARYARRDPTLAGQPMLTTYGATASVEWLATTNLGLRVGGEYVRQSADEVGALDASFKTFTAGLNWYPRGLARPAAGGGP